tara:strand:- start:3309 stop:3608 length:300 start_codon:yes stop_codon:yes gene_type:complete
VQDGDHTLDNVIVGTSFALYLLAGIVNSLLLVFLSATLICVYLAVSGFMILRKMVLRMRKKIQPMMKFEQSRIMEYRGLCLFFLALHFPSLVSQEFTLP